MSAARDRVVSAAVTGVLVASTLVSAWAGVRTGDAALRLLTDPLSFDQTQALVVGLVAAHLMLLQVLLLARVPWLERVWGRDVLVRRHRLLGVWSFWLVVVHVLLFVLQRSTRERDLGPAMLELFVTGHWMVWASIGTALLVLVVLSSLARARAWLRYETWHLLHLWSYLAMGFALPHMLVSVDLARTWSRVWWWSIYLVTLATVLVFRVAVPAGRSAYHRIRVTEVLHEPSGAVTLRMTGRHLERLGARSGQFLVWRFLGGRGWSRGHPYSLSAAPTPDGLRVTVAGSGDGALRAAGLPVGTRVLVEGPYGGFTLSRRRHRGVLMVAAGVGVTPFRALVEDTDFAPGEAVLVVRVHDGASGVLVAELRELCAARGVVLHVLAGPRRTPVSWLPAGVEGGPAEVLTRLVPDVAQRDVYVCGPPDWATALRLAASRAGVAERDLHQESFAW